MVELDSGVARSQATGDGKFLPSPWRIPESPPGESSAESDAPYLVNRGEPSRTVFRLKARRPMCRQSIPVNLRKLAGSDPKNRPPISTEAANRPTGQRFSWR